MTYWWHRLLDEDSEDAPASGDDAAPTPTDDLPGDMSLGDDPPDDVPPTEDDDLDFDDPARDVAQDTDDGPDDDEEADGADTDTDADEPDTEAVVREARKRGMTEDDIETWKAHPELLQKHLDALPAPSDDDAADAVSGSDDAEAADEFEITLDPELYEKDLIDQFETMKQHFQSQLGARDAVLDQLLQRLEQTADNDTVKRFDSYVGELGSAYEKLLGKGPSQGLEPKSEHRTARDQVYDRMKVLAAGYEQHGIKVPSEHDLFKEALRVAYGDDIAKIERDKLASKVNKRAARAVQRPTQRRNKAVPETGEEAATASVAQFMEDHGMLEPEHRGLLQ